MRVKFLDLSSQYLEMRAEIDDAIRRVLNLGVFVGGAEVAQFESEFAAFQHAGYCVGVGNGTDALEIALEALDLPPGSEVLVPANSFIASAEAVTRTGHHVVFCDVEPETMLLDLRDAARKVSERTAAMICVHLYGNPCDMEAVIEFASARGLRVVEDAAQAHGAEWMGRRVGALGDIGCFSFYPGKTLGAYGDGGAIVTDDPALAKKCRMIANHGRISKYDHEFEGRNSRLDTLQAAVLRVKLARLDEEIDRRNEQAARYERGLGSLKGVTVPGNRPGARHGRHLYVVRAESRDGLAQSLRANEIEVGVHYPIPLDALPPYVDAQLHGSSAVVALELSRSVLSLPIGGHLDDDHIDAVIAGVEEHLRGSSQVP